MIIVLDGPEKAGKSTLARVITEEAQKLGIKVRVRNWGPVEPDDRVYTAPLKEDVLTNDLVIWDRSWASEHVYARLLHRDRRLRDDPWLGEWLHGRAVQTVGLRVMVLSDPNTLVLRRDETDLPVDPFEEAWAFQNYAHSYGWTVVTPLGDALKHVAINVLKRASAVADNPSMDRLPPHYCGPPDARVLVVGVGRSSALDVPGAWLPFTSRLTTLFGRLFDYKAFKVGWTNCEDLLDGTLDNRDVVVACGSMAADLLSDYRTDSNGRYRYPLVRLAHPAFTYRWNTPTAVAKRRHAADVVKALLETM